MLSRCSLLEVRPLHELNVAIELIQVHRTFELLLLVCMEVDSGYLLLWLGSGFRPYSWTKPNKASHFSPTTSCANRVSLHYGYCCIKDRLLVVVVVIMVFVIVLLWRSVLGGMGHLALWLGGCPGQIACEGGMMLRCHTSLASGGNPLEGTVICCCWPC